MKAVEKIIETARRPLLIYRYDSDCLIELRICTTIIRKQKNPKSPIWLPWRGDAYTWLNRGQARRLALDLLTEAARLPQK